MQHPGAAPVPQTAIQGGDVLRQGQGGFGQLRFQQVIHFFLVDLRPVAEFSRGGNHTQGHHGNIVTRQLFVTQVAGSIRHQRNFFTLNVKHKKTPLFHIRDYMHYKPPRQGASRRAPRF